MFCVLFSVSAIFQNFNNMKKLIMRYGPISKIHEKEQHANAVQDRLPFLSLFVLILF